MGIIPFTLETDLRVRRVGDKVNVETDLIGKYVQNLFKRSREISTFKSFRLLLVTHADSDY